jgi:hypothetical protein
MAFNLSASLQSSLTTTVNSVKSLATTAVGNVSAATGLSTQTVSSAAIGGVIGSLAGGARGAALGALVGGAAEEFLGTGAKTFALGANVGSLTDSSLFKSIGNKLETLIGEAEEITGLIDNPLKIVERGVADLKGLTGDEYGLVLEQYRVLSERSNYTAFVDNGYISPYDGDDTSASRIPNPLRNHNGYNYKITLGVLDAAEYNNPESYRSAGGFKNYVIQSSGGNLDKRYQVFDETGGGQSDHAEYYIDDITLDAVIAPNGNTRVTTGTTLEFTVTEPYSMGNFIQAIIGAADQAGHSSYTQAPFCLKIDFVGWNEGGQRNANFITRPIFVPIQIVNMDFNVSGTGSKYTVKAVPMSETGLTDNVNKINTSIRASGVLLHQILETNDNSVTSAINAQIQTLEEAGALAPYDRYVIAFPRNRAELLAALQTRTITETAFTTSAEEQQSQRTGTRPDDGLRGTNSPTTVTITPPNDTYAILKTFAENTNLMNEIGLSPLNEDTNAPGNSSEADANAVINPETGLVDTQSTAAQPATVSRDFQFNQGQQITSIIERMVLQTRYAAEKSTEGATNGLNKWFRIETHVFLDESPATEAQMGRKPKVYVYSVIPYEVDEAVTMANGARAQNTQGLRASAAKEYNYIYTGKNEDVLNFDINFNNAFMLTANSDFGMTTGTLNDTNAGTVATTQTNADSGAVAPPPGDLQSADDPTGGTEFTNAVAESAGTHSNDVRRQIAEMFHDRITNMTVDMVTAEMEIMGDPFFIPQETGNYVAQRGDRPNATNDGTMTYLESSVFCVVNFRTPFDYQVKGATMEFPQIVPGFSGLFQIWAVTNNFSGGKFTQTLKMIRRRGQDDPATTGNSTFIQPDNSVAIQNTTTQSDGTVGQSGVPNIDCMPVAGADDIRNLMPAVPADVAAELAAPFKELEDQLRTELAPFKTAIEGVDFGVGDITDLTKIVPRLADTAGSIAGSIAGNSVSNLLQNTGLNSLAAQAESVANNVANDVQTAVNTSAEAGISALSDTASKVRNLLG